MTMSSDENPQHPRPLFLYGPLQALPLLALAITGEPAKVHVVNPLVQPADYPAVVKIDIEHADSDASAPVCVVDVLLFHPQNWAQRKMLGWTTSRAVQVDVEVTRTGAVDLDSKEVGSEIVRADLYVWNGGPDDVSEEEWDLEAFIRERLYDWLELFGGIELVGDDKN